MVANDLDWVAIYGAVLSTVVAIERLWSARPRLKVEFEIGNFQGDFGVYLTVRNPTSHGAYIDAIGVKCIGIEATLNSKLTGKRLEPHSLERMHVSNERIASIMSGVKSKYMKAFVTDALGRKKYGAWRDMTEFRKAESDG